MEDYNLTEPVYTCNNYHDKIYKLPDKLYL